MIKLHPYLKRIEYLRRRLSPINLQEFGTGTYEIGRNKKEHGKVWIRSSKGEQVQQGNRKEPKKKRFTCRGTASLSPGTGQSVDINSSFPNPGPVPPPLTDPWPSSARDCGRQASSGAWYGSTRSWRRARRVYFVLDLAGDGELF